MSSRFFWLVLGLLCISCKPDDANADRPAGSKTDTAKGEAREGRATNARAAPSTPPPRSASRSKGTTTNVVRGRFDASSIPDGVKVRGKVVGGVTWTDSNGTNVLVLSERRTAEDPSKCRVMFPCEPETLWLFAEHAVVDDGAARSLRTVRDFEKRCEFDLVGTFIDEALEVTDLDQDGIGEVTFAYRYTCTSDVSPFQLKLLVLENGDKYIIRGTTRIDVGGGHVIGGVKKVDRSLEKGDPRFRSHANRVWDRVVGLDPW